MEELVIFKNILSISAMIGVIVLYLAIAAIRILFGDKVWAKTLVSVIGGLNFALHIALFAVCMYIGATYKEVFFILVTSTALALAVTRRGKEEEEK